MAAIASLSLLAAPSETAFLWPTMAMVGALLIGAMIIAWLRRWQNEGKKLSPGPNDELAQYRLMYERGEISAEEFARLRAKLGGEIRRTMNLPPRSEAVTPKATNEGTTPKTQTSPDEPEKPPSTGIRPE